MRTRTLIRPTGTDAVTDYSRQQVLKQDELQFFNSTTIKVQQKGRGITFHVINPQRNAAAKATSDYAGVYVPGQSYDTDEWVVIQAGPGQGAYISTADGNKNDPRTGINWVQFSSLNQWF